ncbi:helix-turn-helix domain-containing protein [Sphingobium sp. DC-2]|uniref:helix-turn-helix domain-containing protein n=1 Tax=Sphingobium sp. DC-2 TaxID=1303256 RepID=UPI0004C3093E|nr:helix-turn-helix transcriptional regulator [Sphingobium sp. DC-2]
MTPGTYLAKRRHAAGLSIDDVAALVSTSPRLGEIDRRAWIDRIEKDVAAISPDVAAALADAFPISRRVLQQLIDLRSYGSGAVELPRICLDCGCTEFDACLDPLTGTACAWASEDLCTSCTGKDLPDAA